MVKTIVRTYGFRIAFINMSNEEANKSMKDDGETTEKESLVDDISVDENGEGDPVTLIKKLREKLKRCEALRNDYLSGWQRARADYINLERRSAIEKEESAKLASLFLMSNLLSTLDSFEAALGNKGLWAAVPENWREGMENLYRDFRKILEKHGLIVLNPLGELFNSAEHIAAEVVTVTERDQDGKISEVLKKGYKLYDRVIRPAEVRVSKLENPGERRGNESEHKHGGK